jgi:hypothetical protein
MQGARGRQYSQWSGSARIHPSCYEQASELISFLVLPRRKSPVPLAATDFAVALQTDKQRHPDDGSCVEALVCFLSRPTIGSSRRATLLKSNAGRGPFKV